jgi:hypothetical protein
MVSFVGTTLLMMRLIQDRCNNEISACYVETDDTKILSAARYYKERLLLAIQK